VAIGFPGAGLSFGALAAARFLDAVPVAPRSVRAKLPPSRDRRYRVRTIGRITAAVVVIATVVMLGGCDPNNKGQAVTYSGHHGHP
jgi:hypothetical protein